ncbi:MAG: ABC transporter substrate-binding protein [Acetobacteraceae bacterium]
MRSTFAACCTCLTLLAPPAAAQPSQSLSIGAGGAFTSMDPHYHNLGPNNILTTYVFEPLVRFDPKYQVEPSLAVSWKTLDDQTWEFKLREGVAFHDGTPFTADDVIFTYERVPKVLNSPSSFNFAVKPIVRMEVVDPHTIRFHTAAPVPLLANNLVSVRIVSRKHGEAANTAAYNALTTAIGTGPYRVTEFSVGERAMFQRNDAWWDKKPAWTRVTYRAITNDASRNAALQSGEIDIIDQVPPRDVEDLRRNQKISVVSMPGQRLIYLAVDSGRKETPWVTDAHGKRLDVNPLQDIRVRKALSLAINRGALRDRIMDGFSAPTGQLMPQGTSGHIDAIKPDPYQPDQAKKLLAEAGYPEGFGLTLHGPNNRYVNDSKLVEAIAQMWTRIGVKTAVDTMPAATFFSRAVRAEFSVRLTGWASDTGEASSNLTEMLASSNPAKGRGAVFDPARYANPEVDAIIEQSLATIDLEQREALYRKAELMALPEYPVIPLHHQVNVFALRKGLVFNMRMQEGIRAWDVQPQ